MTAIADQVRKEDPWTVHFSRIREIRQEVPGIATYELAFEDEPFAQQYSFQPGQFNMMYLPGFGESAISISSDPERRQTLAHTVRVVGNVTQALSRLQIGDQVGLRGPFGTCWPTESCHGMDIVIAAGGVGLAPLRPALYHIMNHRQQYGRVFLLYGARTPNDLLYTAQYEAWREAGIEVEITVDLGDAGWQGHIGVVPMLFYRLRLDASRTCVFTCGPEIMMRFVIFEAFARRVPAERVYLSMERKMMCGMGFCGHCLLGPAFVCKDGPVFTYQQIEPFLHTEDL
jgi:NAD(P)H-flavin reductase